MNDLLERTRLATLERVREVRRTLDQGRSDERALDQALRELHAIKGETAMGGLRSVSQLAHALETLVIQRRSDEPLYLDDVHEALRVLVEVLTSVPPAKLVACEDIDALLTEVRAAAGEVPPRPTPPRVRPPASSLAPPAREEAPTENRAAGPDRAGSEARQVPWVRVDARNIDGVSDLISEVLADLDGVRAALADLNGSVVGATRQKAQALAERLDGVRARVGNAEERIWGLRLVAASPTLQEVADHAERLARQLGKNATIEVDAAGVTLERGVVEALREPLLHLARNAVDHGIERPQNRNGKEGGGVVRFQAESQGGEILISIEDDGAGIDAEAIRSRAVELGLLTPVRAPLLSADEILDFIFADGFSQLPDASEVSGRGVGLAAVRSGVEGLGGAVRVSTSLGHGTRFELVLPAAVARERVLVVETAGLPWAIPSRWIRTVIREPDALARARRERMLRLKDGLVPARAFSAWLGAPREEESAAVVIEIAGRRTAFLVGRTDAEVDLLRAPTDRLVAAATRVAASGVLADGRTAFFPRWAEVLREATQLGDEQVAPVREVAQKPKVLIVDDSSVIRDIVGEVLSNAGIEVVTVEDGKVALELVNRTEFDLVVTDIEMPRMTGLELLQAIRARSDTLPVVMLTTRNRPEHRREAALLGANAYIAKSEFHGDTLMEVVRRFVDVSR